MRAKHLTLLVAIFAILTMMFVSCNSEVAENSVNLEVGEELVYASFTDNSKALNFSYDVPAYADLYWRYSAVKKDAYGKVGQTWDGTSDEAFVPVPTTATTPTKGLDGKVGPFSQGKWDFKLQAFRRCVLTDNTLVFSDKVFEGTATNVVLNKNQTNYIAVTVTPAGDTGKIKISDAYYEWASSANAGTAQVKLVVTLVGRPDGSDSEDPVTYTYNEVLSKEENENKYKFAGVDGYIAIPVSSTSSEVTTAIPAGVYTATFKIVENTDTPTIDEFVLQTFSLKVYGGLETIVSGNLTEGLSYENYFSVPEQTIAFTTSTNSGSAEFDVPKTPSTATGESIKTTVVFPDNTLSSNTQHTLTVDVTTIETAETQFVIVPESEEADPEVAVAAIGLELTETTVTKDGSGAVTDTTTEKVADFSDYVTITTFIQDGLIGKITVVYNDPNAGTSSAKTQPIAKEGATAETEGKSVASWYATDSEMGDKLGYSAETGKLRFKTDHFSDFYVKTDGLCAKNVQTGRYYSTLQTAVDAALKGQTVQVIKEEISGISSVIVDETKDISIDLNGCTISTGLESEGRHYYAIENYGTLALLDSKGNGTIRARGIENLGGTMTIESGKYYAIDTNGGAAVWNENNHIVPSNAQIYIRSSDFSNTDPIDVAGKTYLINEGKILLDAIDETYTNLGWVYFPDSIDTSGYGCYWYVKSADIETKVAELTINGGSFFVEYEGPVQNGGPGCIRSSEGTILTINNATKIDSKCNGCYAIIADGTTYIKYADVYGAKGALAVDSGSIVIDGGNFSAEKYYALWITNDGQLTSATINDGHFRSELKEGPSVLYVSVDDGNQDASDADVSIYGGKFEYEGNATTKKAVALGYKTETSPKVWTMTLYGGLYNVEPEHSYAAPGYTVATAQQDGWWTVRPVTEPEAVAKIVRNQKPYYFMGLQDAVDAATSSETIHVIKSFALDESVEITKSLTINGNSFTITNNNSGTSSSAFTPISIEGTSDLPVIVDIKDLTLSAGSSVDHTYGVVYKAYSSGTMSNCVVSSINRPSVYARGATLVLNNVKATSTHKEGYTGAGYNLTALAVAYGCQVTVNGENSEFIGPNGAFLFNSSGTLTVNNGSFKTNVQIVNETEHNYVIRDRNDNHEVKDILYLQNYTNRAYYLGNAISAESNFVENAKVTIESGTFLGSFHCVETTDKNYYLIKGGSFEEFIVRCYYGDTTVGTKCVITGGTFNADPSAYVADGYYAEYHPAANPNPEYWTVKEIPADAIFALINNDTKAVTPIYDANRASITDNGNGIPAKHTLKMLKDYTYTAANAWDLISFKGDSITFDLNGHTFTFTWESNSSVFNANGSTNLTFKNGTITHTDATNTSHAPMLFLSGDVPDEESFIESSINYYGISYPNAWYKVRQMPVPNN